MKNYLTSDSTASHVGNSAFLFKDFSIGLDYTLEYDESHAGNFVVFIEVEQLLKKSQETSATFRIFAWNNVWSYQKCFTHSVLGCLTLQSGKTNKNSQRLVDTVI